TNLSQDHLDYHGDMERYGAAKRRLFELPSLTNATVNCADGFGRELAQTLNVDCRGYLLCADEAACATCDVQREYCVVGYIVAQTAASMHLHVRTSEGDGALHTSLLGRFNAENLLAALSIVLSFGVPVKEALAALSSVCAPEGRMERVSAPASAVSSSKVPTVVVDYAHTPDALRSALDALAPITQGELWCVFGCGGERDQGKRVLMGTVARDGASQVVITSDNPRREAPENIISDIVLAWAGERPHRVRAPVIEPDRTEAIHFAISHALPGDVVLIAGKGHETYQLVAGKVLEFDDRVVARQALCGPVSC
ncbi:MAG: UDP-N-acetylmuramoyl-L-alanyl-D-glutamate--2,6-diaminopimelate ligase, partial [Gammaproteobacteria bacterium]